MPIFEAMLAIARKLMPWGRHFATMAAGFLPFLGQPARSQPLSNAQETLSVEAKAYSVPVLEQPDLDGGHLQGIQLHDGRLYVSGSSTNTAYLAVFARSGNDFKFIGIKKLGSDPLNHAGGFQLAENWLAIGIEDPQGKRHSVIQLIDVSSAETLNNPPVFSLDRKGEYKLSTAGAVGILKRQDHFLLAVGTWDCTTIDFYRSNHLDPYAADFAFERWTTWDSRSAIRKDWSDRDLVSYQNIQLTEDSAGVFLAGFGRAGNGADKADVFRLRPDTDQYLLMQKVGSYTVQCAGDVTFRNGSGFGDVDGARCIVAVGRSLSPKMQFQIFPVKGY
jgi:hypothetical protein